MEFRLNTSSVIRAVCRHPSVGPNAASPSISSLDCRHAVAVVN